jgi:hypothetical protein
MSFNIDDYTDDDILKFFSIDKTQPITKSVMKKAYRACLKIHPDKSGLDKSHFIFYHKALERLKVIYRMTNYDEYMKERSMAEYNKESNHLVGHSIPEHILEFQKREDFHKQFNEAFEKVKMEDPEHDSGYDTWMKETTPDTAVKVKNVRDMNEAVLAKKREIIKKAETDLMMYNTFSYNTGTSLMREKPVEYSSDIFSKLQYEDFRKAHTETVIPVDESMMRQDYKTVDEYNHAREKAMVTDVSKLKKQQELDMEIKKKKERLRYIQQQQYLHQSEKKSKEKQDSWLSSLLRLTK